MRGLTIVVADMSSERFRTALVMAAAHAALGGKARLFLQGEAVSILRAPIAGTEDETHEAAGLPTLGELIDDTLALGVTMTGCQSGQALFDATADEFHPALAWAGMTTVLAELGEDRLVVV
jgi:predicted peroxiredoxin